MAKHLMLFLMLAGMATVARAEVPVAEARRLIQSGEILPLEQVIALLQKQRRGHAIEVELEHEHSGYRYEIEWLDPSGKVWELDVDARTGRLLHSDGDD